MTSTALLTIAARVIATASRELPADTALRNELRSHRGLTRDDGAWISRAVFAFHRWRGWLDAKRLEPDQIRQALELAETFRARPNSFPDDELIERAVPAWALQHADVNADWIRAIQAEPVLWLRAKRGHGPSLTQRLGHVRESFLPDALRYEGREDLFRRPEFHAGEFEIQDIASQAVGFLCNPRPEETWWDTCAGEGGKTLHLSDLMENRGLIWSSDRAAWRLKMLKRRAARARCFNYRVATWDGGAKLPTRTKFDGVLIDAPCAGLGTWQRNPQARWTTSPEDVRELSEIQRRLLANAAPAVKTGGRLIYAVCTMTNEETREVVEHFESEHADFHPASMNNPFDTGAESGRLWLRPEQTGGNGMFIAAWRKS